MITATLPALRRVIDNRSTVSHAKLALTEFTSDSNTAAISRDDIGLRISREEWIFR